MADIKQFNFCLIHLIIVVLFKNCELFKLVLAIYVLASKTIVCITYANTDRYEILSSVVSTNLNRPQHTQAMIDWSFDDVSVQGHSGRGP